MRYLLFLTLAGSGLGLFLILLRRILRHRLPSAFFYAAWLLVLLRLALPLPGLIPIEKPDAPLMTAAALHNYHYDAADNDVSMPARGETNLGAADTTAVYTETQADVTEAEPEKAASPTAVSSPKRSPLSALVKTRRFWVAIWLAGAVLSMGHTLHSYRRFYAALLPTLTTTDGETARVYASFRMKRKPTLLCSPHMETPMLLGLFRPLIVLPAKKLPPETAQNVLLHELTHFRRGDLFFKWFAALIFSLHWFNPLMLLFRREINQVCELSCDERVLLLAAIRPDTRILLAPGEYDLSTAGTYGEAQDWYYWDDVFDGYQLVIENMDTLTIASESGDPADVTISAEARYANVMLFKNCTGITFSGITAGHTWYPTTRSCWQSPRAAASLPTHPSTSPAPDPTKAQRRKDNSNSTDETARTFMCPGCSHGF